MLDFDNDGLSDIYVCNYGEWTWATNRYCGKPAEGVRIYCGPLTTKARHDVLLKNLGDGTFADVSQAAGICRRATRSQGIVVADFNSDGNVDFYLGNDLHANSLFLNRGDGTFEDASEEAEEAYDSKGTMQLAWESRLPT